MRRVYALGVCLLVVNGIYDLAALAVLFYLGWWGALRRCGGRGIRYHSSAREHFGTCITCGGAGKFLRW